MLIEHPELKNFVKGLFENYFPKFYEYIESNKVKCINFEENLVLINMLTLFEVYKLILKFLEHSSKLRFRRKENW